MYYMPAQTPVGRSKWFVSDLMVATQVFSVVQDSDCGSETWHRKYQ